jgi:hypothetical protein
LRRSSNELAGPLREVVYIFDRNGVRGAAIWLLILECGHPVVRKRLDSKMLSGLAQAMFRPLSEKLAPKRAQCHRCGSGAPALDPWHLIRALGGELD